MCPFGDSSSDQPQMTAVALSIPWRLLIATTPVIIMQLYPGIACSAWTAHCPFANRGVLHVWMISSAGKERAPRPRSTFV